MPIDVRARTKSPISPIAATLLTAVIFVIDTLTPLGLAIAVLYALVIMLSANFLDRRGIMIAAGICVVFTVIGFFTGHGETFETDATIRFAISLCAILVTTFLTLKNQESTLRLKNQAALLDLTHDAIFVRDANDVITYWNRGAEELYGWTAEEAIGRKTADLLQTHFPMEAARVQAEFFKTGRWEGEVSHVRRDGTEVVVGTRWALYRDKHGKPVATMETNSDVTDRRKVEDALRKTQTELSHVARVTTLGELAASIAHEVNQPLAAIITNGEAGLRWLGREPPNIDATRTSLEKTIGNGRRASDVIARLRALARRSNAELVPLSLNEVVDDVLLLVQRELIERRIDLDLSFDPSLPQVLGDRIQLQQVIINLVMNALQAMEDIEGRPRNLRIVTRREISAGDDNVFLEVADSGVGIDPEKIGSLFTAFYSTKEEGMGMGLSISRSIVEAHHGQICASANKGMGATFTVRLPSVVTEDA